MIAEGVRGGILNITFSADGKRLLLGGGETLRLLDSVSGKDISRSKLSKLDWAIHASNSVLFPDGRTAALTVGYAGLEYSPFDVLTLDLISGKILRRLANKHLGTWEALSPDGKAFGFPGCLGE